MPEIKPVIDDRKDILLLLLFSPGATDKKNEPISGRTRLMKLLFLAEKELLPTIASFRAIAQERRHNFVPYLYGPFSKDVFNDIQFLENARLINEGSSGDELSLAETSEFRLFYDDALLERIEQEAADAEAETNYREPVFTLSKEGESFTACLYESLSARERKSLQEFKAKYGGIPLTTLLRYIYTTYPESASQSEIKWRICP